MAAGRTIPVDEVIAEACTVIKNVTEQEKIFMRQWAYTALRKIGLTNINIQVSDRLYLDDWSVKKPDNLIRTNDIALYNSNGNEILTKFKGYASGQSFLTVATAWVTATAYSVRDRVTVSSITYKCIEAHTSGTFSTDLGNKYWEIAEAISGRIHQDIRSSSSITSHVAITESENYFNVESFSDNIIEDIFLIVRYYAIPVDEEGLPKIPEYCTLAIIMYIRAMWAIRDNTNQSHIQLSWQMWKEERASAEGRGKTPDMIEGKAIAETLNSMIQKTTINRLRF